MFNAVRDIQHFFVEVLQGCRLFNQPINFLLFVQRSDVTVSIGKTVLQNTAGRRVACRIDLRPGLALHHPVHEACLLGDRTGNRCGFIFRVLCIFARKYTLVE